MARIKKLISKLKKVPKTRYIAILITMIVVVSIAIPTLSRFRNRVNIESLLSSTNAWDGTIATSYNTGEGTIDAPYIISNAKELAYFAKMLETTNYENTYFELSNDILINNGLFDYSTDNGITYKLEETTFYVKENTTDIYNNKDRDGEKLSSINNFKTLDNFKGHFNGNYYSIYGLYITNNYKTELALFDNLKGTVENLYLENAMIYGGSTTAALTTNAINATIKDIFISGNVVGTTNKKIEQEILTLEDKTITKEENKLTDIVTLPSLANTSVQVRLTGTYQSTEESQKIMLNNQEILPGDFSIDISLENLDSIELVINDDISSEITLTNLKYISNYETDTTPISAGVIAKSNSSTLKNIINKANVYGTNESAGIIGNMSNTDLSNAYNKGNITAETTASGLIGTIENSLSETKVLKTYNNGTISAITTNSFINKISNNESVVIENTFNTQEAYYGINIIENTEVTANNVIDVNTIPVSVGEIKGNIITDVDELEENVLEDKTYLKETLLFKEYIDSQDLRNNPENAWIYEEGYLPILYFDDLNNPLATLYVGTYAWDDLGYDFKDIYINHEVAFRITANDETKPYKEVYYHIHKENLIHSSSERANTLAEIEAIEDWTLYTDVQNITTEGYYIIYVKVIDQNDKVTYITSERLVVDLKVPTVNITMNDNTWTSLHTPTEKVTILEKTPLTVTSNGAYAAVTSTKYYLSNKELTEEMLENIEESKWIEYNDSIELTECGTYIVYIKATDQTGRITYINSDTIVFGGYNETISIGRNTQFNGDVVNITSNSSIRYNFTYEAEKTYQEGDKTYIVTNALLPVNTMMTLIDNTTNEVYKYKIASNEDLYGYETSCQTNECTKLAKYPLGDFIKLGQTDTTKKFNEEEFINNNKKDLTLVIDFSKTEITSNFSFETYLETINASDVAEISTLKDTIKTVNVYTGQDSILVINKVNDVETINYNSDSETEISFETYLSNQKVDNMEIYDTTKENSKLGIAVKLVDSESNIIEKKHLKNIKFQVGENYYSPDNDGIVRIDLSNTTSLVNSTLKIITYLSNTKLELGEYSFVITPFVAADGKYTSNLDSGSISIPVSVTNKQELDYGFKTMITVVDEENNETEFNSVIEKNIEEAEEVKENPTTTLKINVLENIIVTDKMIKVSLYKKSHLPATDQTYELIDLQEHVNTPLTKLEENKYLITNGNITIELDNKTFENNGYELRFELYDGQRQITSTKKKFIVK